MAVESELVIIITRKCCIYLSHIFICYPHPVRAAQKGEMGSIVYRSAGMTKVAESLSFKNRLY